MGRLGGNSSGKSNRPSASDAATRGYRSPRRSSVFHAFRRQSASGVTYGRANSPIFDMFIAGMVAALFFLGIFPKIKTLTPSTIERQPLPASAVTKTDYYLDEAEWITDPSVLERGLQDFYERTGVQPFLYILKGDGPQPAAELNRRSRQLYEDTFTDEGHFMLMFYDYGNQYYCGFIAGEDAKSVMDEQAITILSEYIARGYSSMKSPEKFFSTAFEKTGKRIMSITIPIKPALMIAVVAALLLLVLLAFRRRNQRLAKWKKKN